MLEELHSKKIIYRDLKPENLVLNKNGYLKLIDFGTAKFMDKDKTYTLMGSLHYIAPEVMEDIGYGFECDLFSFGVVFYELICGCLPFGEEEEDPMTIYNKIL